MTFAGRRQIKWHLTKIRFFRFFPWRILDWSPCHPNRVAKAINTRSVLSEQLDGSDKYNKTENCSPYICAIN